METLKMNNLERSVYGQNLINKLTIENITLVLPQLQKFLNKKICLANGNKAKVFELDLLQYKGLRTYLHFTGYNLDTLSLKQDVTIRSGECGVIHFDCEVNIGTLNNGILQTVLSLEQLIQSYSLDVIFCAKKVKETKDKIEQLENETRSLKTGIYKFVNTY